MKIFYFLLRLLILINAFGILIPGKSDGQIFSKYAPGLPVLNYMINAQGGGYYAIGGFTNAIMLVRLNELLNVLWSKQITDTIFGSPYFFRQEINSHLLLGGRFSKGGFYLEMDSSGNPLLPVALNNLNYFISANHSSNNELYLLGTYHNSISGTYGNMAVKYDISGNILWSKKSDFHPYSHFLVNSFFFNNSVLMLTDNPDGGDCNIKIEEIDSLGNWNILLEWNFQTPDIGDPSFSLMPTGKFLVSCLGFNWPSQPYNFLCIIDGHSVQKQIGYEFQYAGNTFALDNLKNSGLQDGGIICAGNVHSNESSVCVFKTDLNLDIQWAYILEDSSNAIVKSVLPSSDGGFILSLIKSGVSELIKIDSLGNTTCPHNIFSGYSIVSTPLTWNSGNSNFHNSATLTSMVWHPGDSLSTYILSDYCIGTGITKINSNNIIIIYPYPASEKISLSGNKHLEGKLLIQNLSGKNLLIKKIDDNEITIDIQNYSPGIYFISIINDDNIIRRKFVKL